MDADPFCYLESCLSFLGFGLRNIHVFWSDTILSSSLDAGPLCVKQYDRAFLDIRETDSLRTAW